MQGTELGWIDLNSHLCAVGTDAHTGAIEQGCASQATGVGIESYGSWQSCGWVHGLKECQHQPPESNVEREALQLRVDCVKGDHTSRQGHSRNLVTREVSHSTALNEEVGISKEGPNIGCGDEGKEVQWAQGNCDD